MAAALPSITIIAAAAALAGCAHGRVCGAIGQPYSSASLAQLECSASTGDRFAQLELGIRYEEGAGVARNLDRAERLYARAARTERRQRYVYSPPVGRERHGRLITLGTESGSPGLSEARDRLRALRSRRRGRS